MRAEWKSVRLDDVAQIVNGGTPKTSVSEYWDGEHLWITPAEMGGLDSPYIASSRRRLTDAGLKNTSASLVPINSVILSTRAPIGHLVINKAPMAFNQGCRGLVPGKAINYKYLYYLLFSSVDLLNELGSGTTFKELSAGKLKNVKVPLPPLPEQKRIVAILDEAFAGIDAAVANTEKNLANARELFESYLGRAMARDDRGWNHSLLSRVCTFENGDRGKNYPSKAVLVEHGRPFVNAGDLLDGNVSRNRMNYIPEARYQLLSNGKFEPGDILFCLRGSLGKFGMVDPDLGSGAIASSLVIVRPKADGGEPEILPQFLMHYFRSQQCSDMIRKFAGGAAQPNLGARDLARFEISYPSLEDQKRLSGILDEFLDDTRRLSAITRQKLNALKEFKQSLPEKAFSGELTASPEKELETALA